ncbi:hypothetical protein NM688_g3599 [Phlebia brevispora]|uniref:Uncharacterized protein n=1 Tax=Phlebia brevispora TaxID=194682 RepID=A0ACC1T5I6_9APHY|nr:hypothetical protein NM688_g3599 [Phlebia brevispora]
MSQINLPVTDSHSQTQPALLTSEPLPRVIIRDLVLCDDSDAQISRVPPLNGHQLMALFPPTSPHVRRPTSEYFLQEERAFFSRAGKEIVRVRAEADFWDLHENVEPQQQQPPELGHVDISPRLAPSQAHLSEIPRAPANPIPATNTVPVPPVPTANTTIIPTANTTTIPFFPMNLDPSPQAPGPPPLGGEEPSEQSHLSHPGSHPYRSRHALQEYERTEEIPSTSSHKDSNPSRRQHTENAVPVTAYIKGSSHRDWQHRLPPRPRPGVTPAQLVFPVNLHLSPLEMVSVPGAPHPRLGIHQHTGEEHIEKPPHSQIPLEEADASHIAVHNQCRRSGKHECARKLPQSQASQQVCPAPVEEADLSVIAVHNQRRRSGKHTKRVFVKRL